MDFTFTVSVSVSRSEGKFAPRDELAEAIREAIDTANPGQIEGDNGGIYEVDSWDVDEQEQPKAKKKPAAPKREVPPTTGFVETHTPVLDDPPAPPAAADVAEEEPKPE